MEEVVKADLKDKKFALFIQGDQENQAGKTNERLAEWVEMLRKEFV